MKQDDECCSCHLHLTLCVAHTVAHKYLRWLNNYPSLLNLPFFISSVGNQESICSPSAIQTIIILQNILFLLLLLLLQDSRLLWCDGINHLQKTEALLFTYQINIASLARFPKHLHQSNSCLSQFHLWFCVHIKSRKNQLGLYPSTLKYAGFQCVKLRSMQLIQRKTSLWLNDRGWRDAGVLNLYHQL